MVIDTFLSDKIYNFSPQKISNFSSGLNIKQSCFRERRATNDTGVGVNSVGRGGFDLVDFSLHGQRLLVGSVKVLVNTV